MSRLKLAQDLAAGLGGWLQLQSVQGLAGLSGEDSARLVACQIVAAQATYLPLVSQLPQNWGTTKKRIDIALKGYSTGSKGWYGAIEAKWPGESADWNAVRLAIVQDLFRLAFIETGNLNARFLVVGGSAVALNLLFDKSHPRAAEPEARRTAFSTLLPRTSAEPKGSLPLAEWSARFPGAQERIPAKVFNGWKGKIKTELLAQADARVGGEVVGSVFVWQATRTRGPKADASGVAVGAEDADEAGVPAGEEGPAANAGELEGQ